jgi:hypothetical protein
LAQEVAVGGDSSSENKDFVVSVEVEASDLLHQLAGVPAFGGGNVKAAIRHAAIRSGLSFNRVRKLWYGEARAILATEMDQLRAKAAAVRGNWENGLRGKDDELGRRLEALNFEVAALRREFTRVISDDARGTDRTY